MNDNFVFPFVREKETVMNTNITQWVDSFKNNKNTGVKEEKICGCIILCAMGLVSESQFEEYNNKSYSSKNLNRFTGGQGIINVTQDDTACGTSDLSAVMKDGTIKSYSVTQSKGKNKFKCMCNTSAKRTYNLELTDEIQSIIEDGFKTHLEYMKSKCGQEPSSRWKDRKISRKSNCAIVICSSIAKVASSNWNKKSQNERVCILQRIFDVSEDGVPKSNGLMFVNRNHCRIDKIFNWICLKIKLKEYIYTTAISYFVYHHSKIPENELDKINWIKKNFIIKTQCKFNNGIIDGLGKKDWVPRVGNPLTSWNCVSGPLDDIFGVSY
tara:strand:+ start:251 stop:1228 length:978 start_codon:yes stop_codon:yes gene_type:complete